MSEKLKPCPFCGATKLDIDEKGDSIECFGCSLKVTGWDGCDGHLFASEIWNSRPTEKAAREEVLAAICASKCIACRDGDVPLPSEAMVNFTISWVHDRGDDIPPYHCHGSEDRQIYKERYEPGTA